MKLRAHQVCGLAAIAALVCGFPSADAAEQERVKTQTISLGVVSELGRGQVTGHFSEFLNYITTNISSASVGKVVIAPTPFQLARLIDQKRVDFYMDSPYPTYLINNVHGVAKLLLRRWKGGMAEYRSLHFYQEEWGNKSSRRPQGESPRFRRSRIHFRPLSAQAFSIAEGIQVYRKKPI
jgi:phosphonate transport system substrate-binding protein